MRPQDAANATQRHRQGNPSRAQQEDHRLATCAAKDCDVTDDETHHPHEQGRNVGTSREGALPLRVNLAIHDGHTQM